MHEKVQDRDLCMGLRILTGWYGYGQEERMNHGFARYYVIVIKLDGTGEVSSPFDSMGYHLHMALLWPIRRP